MQDDVFVAVVACVSAIAGGLLTAVIAPAIKHYFNRANEVRATRRERIRKWREMLVVVGSRAEEFGEHIGIHLQRHEEYLSLEPHLSEDTRAAIFSPPPTLELGRAYPEHIELLKAEVEKLEREWKLL